MIAVSACLAGICCRYDGGMKKNEALSAMFERGEAIAICPECLGGLCTPRPPAELVGGSGDAVLDGRARVLTRDGQDVTGQFIAGAEAALAAIREAGITKCVLKSASPSCGIGRIYDGSFSGKLIAGDGVAAALLRRNGIELIPDDRDQS